MESDGMEEEKRHEEKNTGFLDFSMDDVFDFSVLDFDFSI